jgi:hypothetical protein
VSRLWSAYVRRPLVQPIRLASRLALAFLAVRLGFAIAGTIVTAAVLSVASVVAAVAWWARVVEPRLFGGGRPPATAVRLAALRSSTSEGLHLEFTRALAHVADRCLAECEAQAHKGRSCRRQTGCRTATRPRRSPGARPRRLPGS